MNDTRWQDRRDAEASPHGCASSSQHVSLRDPKDKGTKLTYIHTTGASNRSYTQGRNLKLKLLEKNFRRKIFAILGEVKISSIQH